MVFGVDEFEGLGKDWGKVCGVDVGKDFDGDASNFCDPGDDSSNKEVGGSVVWFVLVATCCVWFSIECLVKVSCVVVVKVPLVWLVDGFLEAFVIKVVVFAVF